MFQVMAKTVVTDKVKKQVYARDGYRCVTCKAQVRQLGSIKRRGELPASVDHIVPISSGGSHNATNLQTMCLPCNELKANKTHAEWLELYAAIRRTREYHDWRRRYFDFIEARYVNPRGNKRKRKNRNRIPEYYEARTARRQFHRKVLAPPVAA